MVPTITQASKHSHWGNNTHAWKQSDLDKYRVLIFYPPHTPTVDVNWKTVLTFSLNLGGFTKCGIYHLENWLGSSFTVRCGDSGADCKCWIGIRLQFDQNYEYEVQVDVNQRGPFSFWKERNISIKGIRKMLAAAKSKIWYILQQKDPLVSLTRSECLEDQGRQIKCTKKKSRRR